MLLSLVCCLQGAMFCRAPGQEAAAFLSTAQLLSVRYNHPSKSALSSRAALAAAVVASCPIGSIKTGVLLLALQLLHPEVITRSLLHLQL